MERRARLAPGWWESPSSWRLRTTSGAQLGPDFSGLFFLREQEVQDLESEPVALLHAHTIRLTRSRQEGIGRTVLY